MTKIKPAKYILQTNGLHLGRLKPKHLKNIDVMLVSIDGGEEQTDRNRGRGTYQNIIRNLKKSEGRGFKGELIARMTIPFDTNIEGEVQALLYNEKHPFTSIHWQLDAQFYEKDYDEPSYQRWITENYNPSVQAMVNHWVRIMGLEGRVLRLYPFLGVTESLLTGEPSRLRCGAGWIEFNIQTNGVITPSPVVAGMRDYYLGDIHHTSPEELRDAVSVTHPCPQCDLYALCGGRCLYANVTKLWGDEGFNLTCGTVRNLISSLKKVLPTIKPHQERFNLR